MYSQITGIKPDTIADHENAALNELAIYLLAARYAHSPVPDTVPSMHSIAIHESIQIVTLVRDRLWIKTRELYRTLILNAVHALFWIGASPSLTLTYSDCRIGIAPVILRNEPSFDELLKFDSTGAPVGLYSDQEEPYIFSEGVYHIGHKQ